MIHYWGNIVEAVFWIAIAGIVYVRTRRETDARLVQVSIRAVVALVWFGVSDIIEAGTGAWYRPPGLLLWKAACVAALLHCLFRYTALTKRDAPRK